MLLLDEDSNRRYEVEIMLGATDPSHIIRAIEYWDIERRRYPGYEHAAVLVAENITTRFLNVMSLLAGSIPLIAIQLDALQVNDNIVINFVPVLDQTELRTDDTDDDGGGGQVDRAYWDKKAGPSLMKICDGVLHLVNETARAKQSFNYLRGYIGLQSNGVVRNFIHLSPKRTKKIVHINFRNNNCKKWAEQFEEIGAEARSINKNRLRVTVTASEFQKHESLITRAVAATIKEFDV